MQLIHRILLAGLLALALVSGAAAQRVPLALEGAPDFYQRILTTEPNLRLSASPTGVARGPGLPVFSIFYVFGRQGDWLEVGRDSRRGPEGWLPGRATQPWSMMLTMQYAPQGQRRRVLFMERTQDLQDILMSPNPGPLVARLEAAADQGRQAELPIVSIEPPLARGQQAGESYLIPIVGHRVVEAAGGQSATLLQAGLVNADAGRPAPAPALQELTGAVVFVLDTTISMKPFLDRTVTTVDRLLSGMRAVGLDGRMAVGVVAYRNNMDQEPQRSRLGYVYEVVQPLARTATLEQVRGRLATLNEATVSTHSFNEDAIAGLWTAVRTLDWSPFGPARMIVFVTDAGALSGRDPRAHFRGVELLNVREEADRKGITILPLHIASPLARQIGNLDLARRQYQSLARTGDYNVSKYRLVQGGSVTQFDRFMGDFERAMQPAFQSWAANRPIASQRVAENESGPDGFGALIVNELFNAQQRFIGTRGATRSQPVRLAWVSDRDLSEPDLQSLHVSVYLTRQQLNQLALSVRRILEVADNQSITASAMFRLLQALSGSTAQDPERFRGDAQTVSDTGVLPAFLRLLPYRSRFLNLTEREWANMPESLQEAMRAELASKLRAYREMDADQGNWRALPGGDPSQAVYAMPLEYLP
jgi:serine/threonine-protein kinase PpkA